MITAKKLSIPFMLVIFVSSLVVAASWHEKFVSDYKDKGIDQAVTIAVQEDEKTPDQIIPAALPIIEESETAVLIKALFCSITKPEDVQMAAVNNNISEQTIWEGYQLALTECKRQMQEWYNYIPPGGSQPVASPSRYKKKLN